MNEGGGRVPRLKVKRNLSAVGPVRIWSLCPDKPVGRTTLSFMLVLLLRMQLPIDKRMIPAGSGACVRVAPLRIGPGVVA